jgi:hypothetical protein
VRGGQPEAPNQYANTSLVFGQQFAQCGTKAFRFAHGYGRPARLKNLSTFAASRESITWVVTSSRERN